MARAIQFTKMHGTGNDYIYVNTLRFPIARPEKAAIEWSAYHTGIGSDGLVLIGHSDKADFSMRIFNADGSEAMMCGNASRCIGKYLYEYGLTSKNVITLDTLSGIKILELHLEGRTVETVTVDMGVPLETGTIDFDGEFPFLSTQVSMGNPHLITFVDDLRTVNLSEMGPKLEKHPLFPDRTNVEFAQITGENTIRMRVWERGSGHHTSLRDRCLRYSRSRTPHGTDGANRKRSNGRRHTDHRMGRSNRPYIYDRTGRKSFRWNHRTERIVTHKIRYQPN